MSVVEETHHLNVPEPPHDSEGESWSQRLLRGAAALIVPLGAVTAALAVGAIMLLALGANPIQGYRALFAGAFGGWNELADTALKSMPLLLVGAGICIAFRAGVINIGGEGQIIMGAIFSTSVALAIPGTPRVLLVPIVLLAGALGGGVWGTSPGALSADASVNDIGLLMSGVTT